VIAAITVAYDLLVGGLLVPIVGAMLWKRGTAPAALASIALGSAVVVVMLALRGLNSDLPIYAGLASSLVAYVLVSLGFSRRDIEPVTG
jgi:solute:Na+ symporter, SSS family